VPGRGNVQRVARGQRSLLRLALIFSSCPLIERFKVGQESVAHSGPMIPMIGTSQVFVPNAMVLRKR
jgi:hypothetical protein